MSTWQRCPNCGEPHDVSVHVSGHRLACRRCALPFEVVRNDVAPPGAGAKAPAVTEPPLPSSVEISLTPTQPAGAPKAPSEPPAPPQLPGFELTGLLGRGGMGEVWRAGHAATGREVAVKILSRDLAQDPDFVKRFNNEAAALAALAHPHVVAIVDRGHHGDLFYFAMELIDGRNLRERLTDGPMEVEPATRILGQILSALHHAHQRRIIHRDLKPENVLLDPAGTVKVADFGLAAMRGTDAGERLTRSSVAMGTMSYMAPEQRRDAHGVDARADLYSTGVVLYELLTGDVPAGRFELPSKRRAGIPRGIDAVVERALAFEPKDRYQSAADMAKALADASSQGGLRDAIARWLGGR